MTFAVDTRRMSSTGLRSARVELVQEWTASRIFGGFAMACALRVPELDGASGMVPLTATALFHRSLGAGPIDTRWADLAVTRRTRSVQVRLGQQLTVAATLVSLNELAKAAPRARWARSEAPIVRAPETLKPVPLLRGGATGAVAQRVDWRVITPWTERAAPRELLAWLRPRRTPWIAGGYLDPLWYCVAADLLGPALFAGGPFTIATVSLDLQIYGLTRDPWLLQRVTPDRADGWCGGRVELWDRAGRLVATASQRAVLTPAAPIDLPWSITAFGAGCARPSGATIPAMT